MKFLENTKFTGAALLLLLILNSTLLAVLILRKHGPPPPLFPPAPMPPPLGGHPGPRDFIVHELEMDSVQIGKYDAMIKAHRAGIEPLQAHIRDLRDSMMNMLAANDSVSAQSLAHRIGEDQANMEMNNFRHFRDLRGMCNDKQKPRFDSVIHNALRMMGPPPPPGHGPPPPPPGNGPPPPPPGNGPPPPRW